MKRKTIKILFISVFLLLAFGLFTLPIFQVEEKDAPPRKVLLEEAEREHNLGNYQNALDIYEEIIADDPSNTVAYTKAGHTYRYWSKYSESEEMFLRAIETDPLNAVLWTELGKLYRNSNEYRKAETSFRKSLELDPANDVTYSYGLGYLYIEMGRLDQAEEAFKKAVEINPEGEIGLYGLGDLYREKGQYEKSELAFRKTFELYPNSEAYLGRAWLYIMQGRYQEAIEDLNSFLKNIREKGEVYYALGHAYTGAGQLDKARAAFERAVEMNPDNDLFQKALEK